MRNYNKYEVWIQSHDLVQFIYTKVVPVLPNSERFELTRQLKRAAYSVPFNIVEGSDRNSEKDFVHFLDISFGSILETEYCSLLLKDLLYLDSTLYVSLQGKINNIKAMLIGLIKSIREPKTESQKPKG
ncbi:MAG TPA: four helix bundle protein [Puia sp.]|jgi:four helix bundle protein